MANEKYKFKTFKDGDFSIDIRFDIENDTIWMTQKEIASVFEIGKATLTEHIGKINISDSDVRLNQTTVQDGKQYNTKIYNLEIITLLSYKVRSKRSPNFISWAKKTIQELKQNQLIEINESYNKVLHSNKYEFVKFKDSNKVIDVKVSIDEQTVWLSQDQIALLYGKSISTINEHINNIFKEGELDRNSSFGISEFTPNGKKIMVYNLVFY